VKPSTDAHRVTAYTSHMALQSAGIDADTLHYCRYTLNECVEFAYLAFFKVMRYIKYKRRLLYCRLAGENCAREKTGPFQRQSETRSQKEIQYTTWK